MDTLEAEMLQASSLLEGSPPPGGFATKARSLFRWPLATTVHSVQQRSADIGEILQLLLSTTCGIHFARGYASNDNDWAGLGLMAECCANFSRL